jgi:hypothetical protein
LELVVGVQNMELGDRAGPSNVELTLQPCIVHLGAVGTGRRRRATLHSWWLGSLRFFDSPCDTMEHD